MGISVNGPSGIDTQYIIDSLVAIEQTKVTKIEDRKDAYQDRIDAYNKLKTLLTDLGSRVASLSKLTSFDLFKTTSSNDKVATISGGAGSVDGSFGVEVFQLAANEKMISADNRITSQSATLASMGITTGKISIDGTEIDVTDTDTIQTLRQKINSARDASGSPLGVSASVLQVSANNYRLVLTAKESGSEGVEYRDVTGSTLQGLGIILDAAGDKGITNQTLTSVNDIRAAWTGLAEGKSVQITGTDHAGNAVSASIVKKPGDDENDFLTALDKAFNGMVGASLDEVGGNLVLDDKVGGSSMFSITSMMFDGTEQAFDVEYGDQGAGVLTVGKDAFFSVENVFMSNSTNSAEGFVTGVTFNFTGLTSGESVTVGLNRDTEAIRGKFQGIIDAYNAVYRFSSTNTKVADPTDEDDTAGALSGDMTVRSIVSQLNNMFHGEYDELNTVYTSFSMVGLKTNTSSGELEIDADAFDKAVNERFDEVVNLFTTSGISSHSGVTYGRSSEKTQAGVYTVREVDANHFEYSREGDSTWYMSDSRLGEIVSFNDGPLSGLSLTAASGAVGIGNTFTFTMSKGLSAIIGEAVDKMNDAHEGLVAMRTESYQRSITSAEDQITQLEKRIEKYRLRLVSQFSAMEQALSTLQSQSSNMLTSISSLSSSKN